MNSITKVPEAVDWKAEAEKAAKRMGYRVYYDSRQYSNTPLVEVPSIAGPVTMKCEAWAYADQGFLPIVRKANKMGWSYTMHGWSFFWRIRTPEGPLAKEFSEKTKSFVIAKYGYMQALVLAFNEMPE